MSEKPFEISMFSALDGPRFQADCDGNGFYLRKIGPLEEDAVVLSFEGRRFDRFDRKHSALVVYRNGSYELPVYIVVGPQGSLDVTEKKVEINPVARALLDALVEKHRPCKESKSA